MANAEAIKQREDDVRKHVDDLEKAKKNPK